MNRLNIAVASLFLSLASLSSHGEASFTKPADGSCRSVTLSTCALAAAMGRGINLGEMLDAPKEGEWGRKLEPEYIDKATSLFKTIRLPVRFSNHAALTEDATLDEVFASRIDNIIDTLLAKGVYVILDMHGYSQMVGAPMQGTEQLVDPSVVEQRFLNIWAQLALRYKNKSPKLVFELFNEPTGRLDIDKWNGLAAQVLAVVRKSDPDRAVILGGTNYNGVKLLSALVLPPDRNLIVPVHNYLPFDFTHQGIRWIPWLAKMHKSCCDADQRKLVTDALDMAKQWSIKTGYPIMLGEFGSYSAGDMASRVTWTRFFRDELEKRNFSWTYWNLTGGFGIYDTETHAWIEPLRAALLD